MTDKVLQATHQGQLDIGGKILPCAVLEDGQRVIIQKSIFDAFGLILEASSAMQLTPWTGAILIIGLLFSFFFGNSKLFSS